MLFVLLSICKYVKEVHVQFLKSNIFTLSLLDKNFSRQHFEFFFSFSFSSENRLWHFMQIISFASVNVYFPGKNIIYLLSADLAQSVMKVNLYNNLFFSHTSSLS